MIDLAPKEYNKDIKENPGIYKIILVDNLCNCIKIGRFLGEDEFGILYIGSTDNLQRRLAEIKKSLPYPKNENDFYLGGSHQFGNKVKNIKKFWDKYTLNNITVEIIETDNFRTAETEALENYYNQFGELPPYNDSF